MTMKALVNMCVVGMLTFSRYVRGRPSAKYRYRGGAA
jgi:hypothetical protein